MLRERGWFVQRSAGSHGEADLVALRVGHKPFVIQVKGDVAGPYAHFGPAARQALREDAARAGALALLLWRPPRGSWRWIFEEVWPG